jgi:hypothetical protein
MPQVGSLCSAARSRDPADVSIETIRGSGGDPERILNVKSAVAVDTAVCHRSPQLQRSLDHGVNRATQPRGRRRFAGAVMPQLRHKSAYGIDSDHSSTRVGASRPLKSNRAESGSLADRDRHRNQPRLRRLERQAHTHRRQRRRCRPRWSRRQSRQFVRRVRQYRIERDSDVRLESVQRAFEPALGLARQRRAHVGRVLRR